MAVIQLKDVTFTYPAAEQPAVRNLSLNIEKGQFVVLCGPSGCGKSTLLRLIKKEIEPYGRLEGEILSEEEAEQIGFVFQDPENQIVAENYLQEMVFGLENLGLPTNEMRSRVAEMVHYFGAEHHLHQKTSELSGGKKQQMNLAAVLLMQPSILLLDEPTSQLDPVSARELMDMLVRLNEEFGMTIIMAEHRLEEVFTLADTIVMMEQGRIVHKGEPKNVIKELWETPQECYIPSVPSFFLSVSNESDVPLSVKEGRKKTSSFVVKRKELPSGEATAGKPSLLSAKDVSFRYDKKSTMITNEMNFTIPEGEWYALLGGNGSGKSTFLKILAGILKPERGKISVNGKPLKSLNDKDRVKLIGYMPQNPKLFFLQDTVEAELQAAMKQWDMKDDNHLQKLIDQLNLNDLLHRHPYDLSGGEVQKAAIACLLLRRPKILLLDEPTKGLDPVSKRNLASLLKNLQKEGITILMSSHDVEFAALHASRCGLIFEGKITSEGRPADFFKGNYFYTTMIQRLFRNVRNQNLVTLEEAVLLCSPKN